jgi:hypothetical protein
MLTRPGRQPSQPTRGLPLPRLTLPGPTSSAYYVITTMDGRGRLAVRSPLRILQWQPGLPIAVSVLHGAVVLIHRDGPQTITRQGHLRLPVSIRHACRLKAGDRLLLAANPKRSLLVAYPMAALDSMILAYHATTPGQAAQ